MNPMTTVSNLAVALVALLHLYFLVLEMFLWEKPLGLRTFKLTPEFAKASKALAANQGLYNGFLIAGLVWGSASARPGIRSRSSSSVASSSPASSAH